MPSDTKAGGEEPGNANGSPLVFQLTPGQRKIVVHTLALIQAEMPRPSRGHALERLCLDYHSGHGCTRRGREEPAGTKRTAFGVPLFPDQVATVETALDQAKADTGVGDDPGALVEICLDFRAGAHSRDYANDFDRAEAFLRDRADKFSRRRARAARLQVENPRAESGRGDSSGRGSPISGSGRARAGTSHHGDVSREREGPPKTEGCSPERSTGRRRNRVHAFLQPLWELLEHLWDLFQYVHGASTPRLAQPAPAVRGARTGHDGFETSPGLGVERGTLAGGSPLGVHPALWHEIVREIRTDPEGWYVRRSKRKENGGRRVYYAPHPLLRAVQRRLLADLRRVTPQSPLQRSTPELTAAIHVGRPWFLSLDVQNCYSSIAEDRIAHRLDRHCVTPNVRETVLGLTTLDGWLVQGAPTSPALADLMFRDIDAVVFEVARLQGVSVSRWSDNVGISGESREAVEAIAQLYTAQLAAIGLKLRRATPLPRNVRRMFLGLNLNTNLSVSKAYRRRLASAIRRARRYGCTDDQRRSLIGKIKYVFQIHPRAAQQMKAMLDSAGSVETTPVGRHSEK